MLWAAAWKGLCMAEEPASTTTVRLSRGLLDSLPWRGGSLLHLLLFLSDQPVHFWYFDIIFASLIPCVEMVSDAVVCARGPVAVRPSSGVLIWCQHEAELCSIVCSWTAGEASTRQGAG